jgi:hypothetical protein
MEFMKLRRSYTQSRAFWKVEVKLPLDKHILCDCEAVAHARFCHLGHVFIEPSDYYDAPIYKVLHFIRGVGLIKG